MSRSNQEETSVNPAKRWFRWSGKHGNITYYDKENKTNVPVKMPFTFLLLDELTTIAGFNEAADKGIYSNEVKFTNSEKLNVRCGKNTIEIGLYADIKDAVKAKGGKYSRSCYIAYKDDNGNFEIGNFLMTGSSLSGGDHKAAGSKEKVKLDGWMDFMNTHKKAVYNGAVKMDVEPRTCSKGANPYYIPKFTLVETSEETNTVAAALDSDLQAFLAVYLKKDNTKQDEQATTPTTESKLANTEATYGSPRTREEITAPKEDFTSGFASNNDASDDLLF